MANLGSSPINLQTPSGTSAPGVNLINLNFHYTVTYSGGDYYHYKTNIPTNGSFMGMIEFVGLNYGGGTIPLRAAVSFYCYAAYNDVIQIGLSSCYTGGMTAERVYKSSDGYAVICMSTSNYYSGWVMNSYTANPTTPGFIIQITGLTQTSSTASAY